MDASQQKTPRLRGWTLALIWLGPTAALWGFWVLGKGLLFAWPSFLSLILLPGLAATRLMLVFRSQRGDVSKSIRIALLLGLAMLLLFFGQFLGPRFYRTSHGNPLQKLEDFLPEGSNGRAALGSPELGSPEEMTLHEYESNVLVFTSQAKILLCRYSPEDYPRQKERLEAQYRFRTEPLETGLSQGEEPRTLQPYARLGADEFRFLWPQDGANQYGDRFYMSCLLLITNDSTRELGFLAFRDEDLDLAPDLPKFLQTYCGWELVR